MYLVSVRLAGDNSLPNVGRLEVYYNRTWGTVCSHYFDYSEARVACHMLGFGYYSSVDCLIYDNNQSVNES